MTENKKRLIEEGKTIDMPVILISEDNACSFAVDEICFDIDEARFIAALDNAMINGQIAFVIISESGNKDGLPSVEINQSGVVGQIKCMQKLPGLPHRVVIEVMSEGRIEKVLSEENFLKCSIKTMPNR